MAVNNKIKSGYTLSREWFDFCADNTGKIAPIHTALYMHCIDLCNRLGWKETFGLPTAMAMEILGIKNYKTYIKAFNDLVEWKFVIMIEKSENQYTATRIGLVNFTKPTTKASPNQRPKQVQTNTGIDKLIQTNKTTPISPNDADAAISWRNNFECYLKSLKGAYSKHATDKQWIREREEFASGIDIVKSLKKAVVDYWSTEEAWKHRQKSTTQTLNWRSTFNTALTIQSNQVKTGYNNQNETKQSDAY